MDVTPGSGIVSGTLNPRQAATITVKDAPGGAVLYTKHVRADPNGSFGEGTMPATIVAGNQVRVSFEGDARLTVPETSLTYESITHVIEVHCLPRRKLLLYWLNMQPVDGYQLTADATGLAKLDLDAVGEDPIPDNDQITLECRSTAGDSVFAFEPIGDEVP